MKMLSGSENMYLLQSNYMKPILSALLIVLLFGACKKDKQLTPPKTLIFGMYDAMCNRVPCGRYYLLQNGGLYDQDYFKVPTPAPLNQKSDSLYRIAAKLMNDFPAYLYAHLNDSTFACPGCADGAILRISANLYGQNHSWYMDPDTTKLPVGLRAYAAEVEGVLVQM